MPQDEHSPMPDDAPSHARKRRLEDVTHFTRDEPPGEALPVVVPWALQHEFDGEIDLIKELAGRYPQVPMMSLFHARKVGSKTPRAIATLGTQDGAASLVAEIDVLSRAIQFTFVHSSMLALRFVLGGLTEMARAQWLESMRHESGEAAFLWNQARWGSDYLIGAAHKNFTNLFAFSPLHVEAAVRLTPEVTHRLLDWLENNWR